MIVTIIMILRILVYHEDLLLKSEIIAIDNLQLCYSHILWIREKFHKIGDCSTWNNINKVHRHMYANCVVCCALSLPKY